MKLSENNIKLFWRYIAERHLIYKKKISGMPQPWTADPILQNYKFTNVFRNLDPGTRYVIEKIIPKLQKPEDIIFNIIIYRLYNKIQTMDALGLQHVADLDIEQFQEKLRKQAKKEKIFTSAFIVSGYSFIAGKDKIAKTCNILFDIWKQIPAITGKILEARDSQTTFETIKSLRGIGSFLAYQTSVDIGYWRRDIFNEDVFVVAGPGCKAGIDRLFTDRGNISYEDCIKYLCSVQEEGFKSIGIDMEQLFGERKRLNLMAMENCLCKISKYLKALNNEGRPRNKYRPAIFKS